MRADFHKASGVCAVLTKRFLLFATTALGSLCFATPSCLGQNLVNRTFNQRSGSCPI